MFHFEHNSIAFLYCFCLILLRPLRLRMNFAGLKILRINLNFVRFSGNFRIYLLVRLCLVWRVTLSLISRTLHMWHSVPEEQRRTVLFMYSNESDILMFFRIKYFRLPMRLELNTPKLLNISR